MTATLLIAMALAQASATAPQAAPAPQPASVEIGGQALAADHPATLINMGTAYARQGRADLAADMFRAALASDQRYELQLADGRWVDSRDAARMALTRLQGERHSLSLH